MAKNVALLLFFACCGIAAAQTGNDPKVVVVNVQNVDGSMPDGATLLFQGYIVGREEEQVTTRTGADVGGFNFDLAALPTQWEVGDTLVVDVQHPDNGSAGSDSTELSSGPATLDIHLSLPSSMSPSNGDVLNTRTPQFTWSAVPSASWYQLWIRKRDGNAYRHYLAKWVNQPDASWVIDTPLPCGQYEWWVQSWDASNGLSEWAGPARFEIACCVPGKPVLTSPSACAPGCGVVSYTWSALECATWYQLSISGTGGDFSPQWYPSTVHTGSITRAVSGHAFGTYNWWVRSWGPDGFGPWSSGAEFRLGVVDAVSLSATEVCLGQTCESGFAWAQLWINRGSTPVFQGWVERAALTDDCYELPDSLAAGAYTVFVRTWGPGCGLGPWSEPATFNLP